MITIFKSIKARLFSGGHLSEQTRQKAEDYGQILENLIDGRDDDLAKILVPIKEFLERLSENDPSIY